MPSFESSELGRSGIDGLTTGRIEMLARQLGAGQAAPPDDEKLKKTSHDFATVFYSMAYKEMQESTRVSGEDEADADGDDGGDEGGDEEQDSAMTQGTQDFVGMFMPQSMANDAGDPLTRYIYDSLKQYYGGNLDAKA